MLRLVTLREVVARRPSRRVVLWLSAAVMTPLLLVAAANAAVVLRADGRSTSDLAAVPHAQVAIVPGALVHADGTMSPVLRDRVLGAIRLFRAGTVDKILVSGDHGHLGYDETDTMRDAVLAAGVPASDVFTDYAGFSTWYTMARARLIFGVRSAVVVTQDAFMARSIDLGLAAGIDVHGLDVPGNSGLQGRRADVREVLARVEGLGEEAITPTVTGGPRIPITGDGRASWGPADPDAPLPAQP